jgi:hypothetical protein
MYIAKNIIKPIKDQNMHPCFGVKKIATCLLSQIDNISQSENDELCMVGILGQWGRGKTYLWNQVKSCIKNRQCNKNTDKEQNIYYDVVEFNAWKYQNTPALWAYLYKIVCASAPKCVYIKYILRLWRTWESLCVLFVLLVICCQFFACVFFPAVTSVLSLLQFIDIWHQGKELIPTGIWNRQYDKYLGIQNELEKKLEKLLSVWIKNPGTNKRRVVLYVDDIDRCDEEKMVCILDALRTILENPTIRKRLIVICNLDQNRVISALQCKYNKQIDLHRNVITEQLDKLFIFSVGLPKLDVSQQQRFLQCLYDNVSDITDEHPYSTNRPERSLYALDSKQQDSPINEKIIIEWLQKFVEQKKNCYLTPRKLRIIYWRMLFASSIMADENQVYFTEKIAQNIFNQSISRDGNISLNECFSDILEMVVSY